ncbi:uncharacterized protein LOC114283848 [Camellia sinensis]|uniref:uncharacterized protein LOC114283848 n=1 Tax=Camellia sinensis TaxID=4442 RepID=UPI001035E6B7|nr:uncharacterized protein LOC114283848 [Camellia sinensis]
MEAVCWFHPMMQCWIGEITSIIILCLFLAGIPIAGLTFLLIIGAAGGRNVSARKENGCWWRETLFSALSRAGGKAFSNMVVGYNNVDVNAATKSLKLDIAPRPIVSPGSSQPLVYNIKNSTDASGFSWNDKRSRQGKESSILTRFCLSFLSGDSGAPGALLRRLHLYNIERMDNASLCASLSICPSFLDLEIVGL